MHRIKSESWNIIYDLRTNKIVGIVKTNNSTAWKIARLLLSCFDSECEDLNILDGYRDLEEIAPVIRAISGEVIKLSVKQRYLLREADSTGLKRRRFRLKNLRYEYGYWCFIVDSKNGKTFTAHKWWKWLDEEVVNG